MMKKNADKLEKGRFLNLKFGLIAALSLVLISFEWADYDVHVKRFLTREANFSAIDFTEDIEQRKIKTKRPKVKHNHQIKVVEEPVKPPVDDKQIDLTPDLTNLGEDDGDDCEGCDEGDGTGTKTPGPMKFASAVEIAPYYLECENVLDRTEQTNCSFYKIKEYIQQIAEYPDICRDAGIQGTVHVKFVVSTTGDIQDVEVYRSVHSRLDKEAVKAVKALPNMEPATHNGIRVPVIYTIPVDFIITGH